MADRKVSASMTLEARQFRAEAKAAAEDLQKLSRSGEKTDVALGELQNRAEKAAVSLLKLAADGRLAAAELKKAERQVDDLKGSLIELGATGTLTGLKGTVGGLDGQIAKTKARMRELATEFRSTGSASSLAGFKDAERELKKLEGLAKDVGSVLSFGNAGPAPGLGSRIGQKLSASIGEALGGSYGILGYAIPGLVAAAPTVGAIVGAGILTGVGLAGIGAGIAGQLHDPAIERNASELGKEVSAGFRQATTDFQKPILDGLGIIAAEFDRIQPGLKATFKQLAPLVTSLSQGAAGFVDKLVPGLERAAVASKPLVQDLANWLPKLGSELAGLFTAIAAHEAEAQQGLHILTGTLDLVIKQLQLATVIGAQAFKWGVPVTTKAFFDELSKPGKFTGLIKDLEPVKTEVMGVQASLEALDKSLNATAVTMDTVAAKATNKLFTQLMGVDQANLSVAQSLTVVSDALKQNKRSLDIHKAAGQADIGAILGAVQANIDLYNAMYQATGSADQATAAYNTNTAALEGTLRKAHLTSAQIQDLIGKYKGVPGKVNSDIRSNLPNVLDLLRRYLEKLLGIDGTTVNTYVRQHVVAGGGGATGNKPIPTNQYGGVMIPAASGLAYGAGIYPASNPPLVKFAEPQTRGETLIPNVGIPAARGLALADYAASHYGGRVMGGQMTINLNATFVSPDGAVLHRQLVRYALDTNRTPSQLFPASSR